jgi:hypothetical protein
MTSRKTTTLLLFVVVAVVQLIVVGWAIARHEMVLRNGDLYRFRVVPVDPIDPFRGRYVALRLEDNEVWVEDLSIRRNQELWAAIAVDSDGFARLSSAAHAQPDDVPALRCRAERSSNGGENITVSGPFERFYMHEKLAPAAETAFRARSVGTPREAHITVRVLDGYGVIEDLFIDGTLVSELVQQG